MSWVCYGVGFVSGLLVGVLALFLVMTRLVIVLLSGGVDRAGGGRRWRGWGMMGAAVILVTVALYLFGAGCQYQAGEWIG